MLLRNSSVLKGAAFAFPFVIVNIFYNGENTSLFACESDDFEDLSSLIQIVVQFDKHFMQKRENWPLK